MRLFVSRKFPFNSGATLPLKLLAVTAYILSCLLLPMPSLAQEDPGGARFTILDVPAAGTAFGQGTLAGSINEDGQIMGLCVDTNNVYHGFVRHRHGTLISFDAPGAGTGAFQGTLPGIIPVKISENGAIPGSYLDSNNVFHGFVRDKHGVFTTFDAPGSGTALFQGTSAVGINEQAAIVGVYFDAASVRHAFVRDEDGVFATFDAPGAGTGPGQGTFSFNINDKGAVAGWYLDANNLFHGFVRSKRGAITTFDAPGAAAVPFEGNFALSINAEGEVVGYYYDANMVTHGFLLRFEEQEHPVGRSDD